MKAMGTGSVIEPEALDVLAEGMLDVRGACEFARLSRSEVYRAMSDGRLPYVAYGTRKRLIPKRGLIRLLAGHLRGGVINP